MHGESDKAPRLSVDVFYDQISAMEPRRALLKMYDHARQLERELAEAKAQRDEFEALYLGSGGEVQRPSLGEKDELAALKKASFTTAAGFLATPYLMVEEAFSRLSPRAAPDETAWLIEMPDARWGTGFYWIGPVTYGQYGAWGTIDAAIRFARKEDAEKIIAKLPPEIKYEACEHLWHGAAAGTWLRKKLAEAPEPEDAHPLAGARLSHTEQQRCGCAVEGGKLICIRFDAPGVICEKSARSTPAPKMVCATCRQPWDSGCEVFGIGCKAVPA